MHNIKTIILLILLSIVIGFFMPEILNFFGIEFKTSLFNLRYFISFTVLLPLTRYDALQPLLDSADLTKSLNKREVRRLNNIVSTKKKQLKYLMIFLLIATLSILVLSIVTENKIFLGTLMGVAVANVIYTLYSISVKEEASQFIRKLSLRVESKKQLQETKMQILESKKDSKKNKK